MQDEGAGDGGRDFFIIIFFNAAPLPLKAEPGTIRGDFAVAVGRNVVHGSDSIENGERETALWFGGEGLVAWEQSVAPWLVE